MPTASKSDTPAPASELESMREGTLVACLFREYFHVVDQWTYRISNPVRKWVHPRVPYEIVEDAEGVFHRVDLTKVVVRGKLKNGVAAKFDAAL